MNRSFWKGVAYVFLTYVYFLIFAQYGLIHWLQAQGFSENDLGIIMAAMGIAGLLSSLGSALLMGRMEIRPRVLLRLGFLGCAFLAGTSLLAKSMLAFIFVSSGVGLFLGILTVSLAVCLKPMLGSAFFGRGIGMGTGLAYALANLPWLFEGGPQAQIMVTSLLALIGFFLSLRIPPPVETQSSTSHPSVFQKNFLFLVLGFFCLVWLDSSAFFVIQENPDLKLGMWHSDAQKLGIAFSHLLAAWLVGVWIDRSQNDSRGVAFQPFPHGLLVAFVLISLGYLFIDGFPALSALSGFFYVAGVSVYSTLLVAMPGMNLPRLDRVPIYWRSALVYGIAGWIGSAIGIGMAKELMHVPPLFFLGSGGFLLTSAMLYQKKFSPYFAFLLGAMALLCFPADSVRVLTIIEEGRQVYIEEGCIHCHSQYVRPNTADELNFGHASDPEEALTHAPPLIGYRRQGPDLTHTASRKPEHLQFNHLKKPQASSPRSVMPSYEHLFGGGGQRGNALVAYLDQLK